MNVLFPHNKKSPALQPPMNSPTLALFLVIVLEGYVVLSVELLAIRQTIPYVGSGTDTVSIIIAAVLLPLACGYYVGGRFRPGFVAGGYQRIRDKLVVNMLIAMFFLLVGLSYPLLSAFFIMLIDHGPKSRIALTACYALLFLVTPVYLLGQTIPLVSNYFGKEKLAKITGRILFFSTLGSFMGALLSTLVLMSLFGVNHTVSVIFILLFGLIYLLSKKRVSTQTIAAALITAAALVINSDKALSLLHIIDNNTYNTIMVTEETGVRRLYLNNNSSSLFTDDKRKHDYIEFVERQTIHPILHSDPPRDILVIGAGGFTFGFADVNNHYDFLDIDDSLQRIAEEHLLKEPLTANKTFHPVPARAWLAGTKKQYDLIFMDVFQGDLTIPEHLVTKEFFLEIKAHLKPRGLMAANIAASPNFAGAFSRTIDNTLRSVFPNLSRHLMYDHYQAWNDNPEEIGNAIYIYRHFPDEAPSRIYTDNKNNVFYDRPPGRTGNLPRAGRLGL